MSPLILLISLAVGAGEAKVRRVPPLVDRVVSNLGFVCRWEATCMKRQERAMSSATVYLKRRPTPSWKIRICNRNASRGGPRKDWIGFSNCIRNPQVGAVSADTDTARRK